MDNKLFNKAVVIGGGISGLATAALLGKAGWKVVVIEKNKDLGGRARVLRKGKFAFDMGPSWYLMPEVFERFFQLFGKQTKDYYELIRLKTRYQVYFGEDDEVKLGDDLEENAAWFERIESGAGEKLLRFMKKMETVYNLATSKLIYEDVKNWKSWLKLPNMLAVSKLMTQLKWWESWDSEVNRYFKNEKLKKILEFPAVFLGGSPFNTPALYTILTWADFGAGVWYPRGGMGKVIEALVRLAKDNGVEFRCGEEVTQIVVNQGMVTGVKTTKGKYQSRVVVAATDMPMVETELLPKNSAERSESQWKNKQLGISSLLLYLGLNKRIKGAEHHTMYFSKDWRNNFEEIFKGKILPSDPSMYISVRSVSDRTIVPAGAEEVFVLIPLGAGGDYPEIAVKKYAENIIDKLELIFKQKIRNNLVVKEIFGPNQFKRDYRAYQGTALGLAHTLGQSLWFRPGNKSKKAKGLYFTGQYTNPGVGVPMALISAQLVAEMIGSEVKT